MNTDDLFLEARRNPEQNPRIGIIDQLKKYAGQEDVFVSFTSNFSTGSGKRMEKKPTSKIGINPKTDYNTPAGIYCYPIDYILKYNEGRIDDVSAPYTGRNPWKFIYVMRRTTSQYIDTDQNPATYENKLMEMLPSLLTDHTSEELETLTRQAREGARNSDDDFSRFWNLCRMVATSYADQHRKKMTFVWNWLMRKIGLQFVSDKTGRGIIHPSEPTQAVFFSIRDFNVIDVIQRTESKIDKLTSHQARTIINKAPNLSNVSPKIVIKALEGLYYIDDDKPIQLVKKLIEHGSAMVLSVVYEQVFAKGKQWPRYIPFQKDVVDLILKKLGAFTQRTLLHGYLGEWGVNLNRMGDFFKPLSVNTWKNAVFKEIDYGTLQYSDVSGLTICDANFIIAFCEMDTNHRGDMNFKEINSLIEKNHIEITPELSSALFSGFPLSMAKKYPDDITDSMWVSLFKHHRNELYRVTTDDFLSRVPLRVMKYFIGRYGSIPSGAWFKILEEKAPEMALSLIKSSPQLMKELSPAFFEKHFNYLFKIDMRLACSLWTKNHKTIPDDAIKQLIKNNISALTYLIATGKVSFGQMKPYLNEGNAELFVNFRDLSMNQRFEICHVGKFDKLLDDDQGEYEEFFQKYGYIEGFDFGSYISPKTVSMLVEVYPEYETTLLNHLDYDSAARLVNENPEYWGHIERQNRWEVFTRLVTLNPENVLMVFDPNYKMVYDSYWVSSETQQWVINNEQLILKYVSGKLLPDYAAEWLLGVKKIPFMMDIKVSETVMDRCFTADLYATKPVYCGTLTENYRTRAQRYYLGDRDHGPTDYIAGFAQLYLPTEGAINVFIRTTGRMIANKYWNESTLDDPRIPPHIRSQIREYIIDNS